MIFVGTMLLLNNPFERVEDIKVPNLLGLDYESIKDSAEYADFNIVVKESGYNAEYPVGQIYDQSPSEGRTVKSGATIEVKVSQGTELGTIPVVMGKDPDTVESALRAEGFTQITRSEVYNNVVPSGLVCGINPGEGSEVATSTPISLQISQGPETKTAEVPDLGGLSLEKARTKLEEAGLKVGEITYRSSESSTDTVIGQDPVFGSQVSEGSYVNLTLSSGDRDIGSVQLYITLPENGSATMTATAVQDGNVVMERQVQPNLTNVWKPTLTGYGTAEVEILLDGEHYRPYEVDFDEGTSTQIDWRQSMTEMTEKTETATVQGRIIRALGGFYYIDTPEGLVECRARGVFRKEGVTPYVGDLARAELTGEGKGYLIELLPRKNFLIRPPVANIDLLVLVVSTVSPAPNRFVLDKMLAVAEHKGIEPMLAVTKSDLRRSSLRTTARQGTAAWNSPRLPGRAWQNCGNSSPEAVWWCSAAIPAPARVPCSTRWNPA